MEKRGFLLIAKRIRFWLGFGLLLEKGKEKTLDGSLFLSLFFFDARYYIPCYLRKYIYAWKRMSSRNYYPEEVSW